MFSASSRCGHTEIMRHLASCEEKNCVHRVFHCDVGPPRAARTTRMSAKVERRGKINCGKSKRERKSQSSGKWIVGSEREPGRQEKVPKRGKRREKWQTLSCHEVLDVFILPQARRSRGLLRERDSRTLHQHTLMPWRKREKNTTESRDAPLRYPIFCEISLSNSCLRFL